MAILRVTKPFCVFSTGEVYAEGRLVADSDPNVKGRESHFQTVEAAVATRTVEAATAAPGEKRSRTLPAKKSTKG